MGQRGRLRKQTVYTQLLTESFILISLLFILPLFSVSYIHFAVEGKSSLKIITETGGLLAYFQRICAEVELFNAQCWKVVIAFAVWSIIAPLSVGGKTFLGPPTTEGYRHEYLDSTFRYFMLSFTVFAGLLLSYPLGFFWYSRLFSLTCTTSVLGLLVSLFVFIKGFVSPSRGGIVSNGNPMFDFYWGKELYPRIGQWDLKPWSMLSYGFTGLGLVVLLCWKAQFELVGWNWAMATSSLTVLVYIGRVFWFSYGYAYSFDFQLERMGFHIIWGSVGMLPIFLSCHSIYMVENPSDLEPIPCIILAVLGVTFNFLTFWADHQRVEARTSNGNCKVWGRPSRIIRTTYKDEEGTVHEGRLLASGFWGVVRHPNYLLELSGIATWLLPAKLGSFVPYLWGLFVLGFILNRISKDDQRLKMKYGRSWDEYCELVPYNLIPNVF